MKERILPGRRWCPPLENEINKITTDHEKEITP